jgi:hypothetical protein
MPRELGHVEEPLDAFRAAPHSKLDAVALSALMGLQNKLDACAVHERKVAQVQYD